MKTIKIVQSNKKEENENSVEVCFFQTGNHSSRQAYFKYSIQQNKRVHIVHETLRDVYILKEGLTVWTVCFHFRSEGDEAHTHRRVGRDRSSGTWALIPGR